MTLRVAANKESVPDKHGHAQKTANMRSSSGFLAERWGQESKGARTRRSRPYHGLTLQAVSAARV